MQIEGKTLDEYQLNAIKDEHQSVLLVAGAGSGKTLTILAKIKYLIENNIKEDEILCISFTNKTVNDLRMRLQNLNINTEVLTFHKLGLKLLEDDKYQIVDEKYLNFVVDEYFESYVKYEKKRTTELKRLLYIDDVKKIYTSDEYSKLKSTIITFIKLSKANNVDKNELINIYKKLHFSNKVVMKMIIEIYTIYTNELKSINKIDFDDIIYLASRKKPLYNLKYKYIIIDEFQDSSMLRLNLIKAIIKKTNAKLFAVGDDFQSIYRFSGCNVNIFINFPNYFNDPSIHYLKNTYRTSHELINVSTRFILKNKKQLKKDLISTKHLKKPIKIIYNHTVEDAIKLINDDELLILGRTNKDIINIDYEKKLTIHSAKGLEANNVLLINSDNIPNKIKNERILKYITFDKDYIIYEEERRLFYVALTRTKNNIYILVNNKKSSFIKELLHDYKKEIEIID